jgi:hypothetical protein
LQGSNSDADHLFDEKGCDLNGQLSVLNIQAAVLREDDLGWKRAKQCSNDWRMLSQCRLKKYCLLVQNYLKITKCLQGVFDVQKISRSIATANNQARSN